MMSEISQVAKINKIMATTNNSNIVMNADLTKRGLVSLWEKGGGYCNTGRATIICKADGSKPTAVYVRRRGQLACEEHALVPVHSGYLIIESYHHHGDFEHQIYKVLRTFTEGEGDKMQGKIEVIKVNSFDQGEWDDPLGNLEAAVAAAEAKAKDYHCRSPYWVVEKEKKD